MALFTWNCDYCVGIERLDRQHIEFFDIVKACMTHSRSGQSQCETGPALEQAGLLCTPTLCGGRATDGVYRAIRVC